TARPNKVASCRRRKPKRRALGRTTEKFAPPDISAERRSVFQKSRFLRLLVRGWPLGNDSKFLPCRNQADRVETLFAAACRLQMRFLISKPGSSDEKDLPNTVILGLDREAL